MATSIGPYKSRFFNFINRQVIRFQDQVGKTIRYLKVATKWGVQILLYPIYLVVQTGRMVGHKLKPGTRLESDQQPTDQPIERVLKAVPLWSLLDNIPQNRGIVKIQGVANLLKTGALVLVSTDNQILDILNIEQQETLHKRIIREIANELYREHSLESATLFDSSPVRELPTIETNNSPIVFPLGLFWRVMTWMERGSVAIAIDLFQESTLVPNIIPTPNQVTDLDIQIRQKLAGIAADLSNHRNSQNALLSLIRAAIDYFFGKRNETISGGGVHGGAEITPSYQIVTYRHNYEKELPGEPDPWLTQEDVFVSESGPITKPSEDNYLARKGKLLKTATSSRDRIKTLIYAAIDYFFNQIRVKGIPGKEEEGILRLGNEDTTAHLPATEEVESWLSWPDLFGEAAPGAVKSAESSLLSTTSQVSPSLVKLDSVEAVDSIASEDTREETGSNSWVETEATPMGYSQHPLEKILAWFDRAILFLEERALSIWRWIRGLW